MLGTVAEEWVVLLGALIDEAWDEALDTAVADDPWTEPLDTLVEECTLVVGPAECVEAPGVLADECGVALDALPDEACTELDRWTVVPEDTADGCCDVAEVLAEEWAEALEPPVLWVEAIEVFTDDACVGLPDADPDERIEEAVILAEVERCVDVPIPAECVNALEAFADEVCAEETALAVECPDAPGEDACVDALDALTEEA